VTRPGSERARADADPRNHAGSGFSWIEKDREGWPKAGFKSLRLRRENPGQSLFLVASATESAISATVGLAVDVTIVGTTDGTTSALAKGDVEFAFATPDPALSEPDKFSILAGLVDRPPLSMIAQPSITSFEQLRGVGIGTSSYAEGTVHLITAMMSAHGLDLDTDYRRATRAMEDLRAE
jgi:hypothetical protein